MAGERRLRDLFFPTYTYSSCIQLPEVTVDHYEIEPSTIQSLPSFFGLDNENPYKLLDEFLKICSALEIQGFTQDALRLRLFPFTLKDKAENWFDSLTPNSITSWDQMQQEFLEKYFPMWKTIQIRREIMGFSQYEGEQFYETWKRLKDLLKMCPHHAIPKWQLVQHFYDGLTGPDRKMVDLSCGGTIMTKTENEAWTLFENLSENYVHHASICKMKQIMQAIMGFSQYEGEQFYETWERLMDLLRMYPRHSIPKWQLVGCFYGGLTEPHRQMVDISCGGTIMTKTGNEAWTLLEKLSENSEQYDSSSRWKPIPRAPKSEGLYALGNQSDVTAKVDVLSQKLDQLMAVGPTPSHHPSTPHEACSFCFSPIHHENDCSTLGQFSELSHEQVNSTFSRSSNDSYPNFSWRGEASGNSARPHGLHNQAHLQPINQSFNLTPNYGPPP
jgi:hypothetical protein